MIPFFRKIRKKMADDNRPMKYMTYAIGEIGLVVIGILIALYISEWNRVRLDIQYEKTILSEIAGDLNNNISSLVLWNDYTAERLKKISKLESLLKEKSAIYNKSLDTLFGAVWGIHPYSFDKAKYENLKSRGLNTVQVDSLKEQIILVYEIIQPKFESLNTIEIEINTNVILPYYIKNFMDFNWHISATPMTFDAIWKDNEYHNVVSYRLKTLQNNQVPHYNFSIEQMEKLKTMIKTYLDNS
jgi:hypothetical protein